MDNTDDLVRSSQSKVSKTISAIEVAIASWNTLKEKPEEHARIMASMERLLERLEAWEKRSIKNSSSPDETKKKDLRDLIDISDSYKGAFK